MMATESFYEDLILDTEEAISNLEKALDEAERRGPMVIEGAVGVTNDPEFLRKFMESGKDTPVDARADSD